jgi:molybdopterin converting factor small subunit
MGSQARKVTVKYLGYLSDLYGRQVEVEVDGPRTLRDIVKIPEGVDPDELIYLINGRPAKLDDKVKPGDVVAVMPHISGG